MAVILLEATDIAIMDIAHMDTAAMRIQFHMDTAAMAIPVHMDTATIIIQFVVVVISNLNSL